MKGEVVHSVCELVQTCNGLVISTLDASGEARPLLRRIWVNVVSQIPLTPKLEGKVHFYSCNELYSLSKHQPGLGDLKFYEKTNGSVSMDLIYGQTNGSTGVLCMWGEDAGALIKPQNLDVPGFCCLLFGLPGWTNFHMCHPVHASPPEWQLQAAFLIISC